MSLRARFALASVLATALVVVLAGAALMTLVARDERAALDQRLTQAAAASARPGVLAASLGENRVVRGGSRYDIGVAVRLLVDGQPIAATDDFPAIAAAEPPGRGMGGGFQTIEGDDGAWRVFSSPAFSSGPLRRDVLVQVAAPTDPIHATLRALRTRILGVGVVAIAGAGAGSWWLGAVILRPLSRIRQEAERVSDTSDLAVRVPVDQGPPEVDELGASLNRMLERIGDETARTEAALEAARSFASNAAHELRTPLTSMQTNLDVLAQNPDLAPAAREEILREITEQQQRLLTSLEALRLLARGDLRRDDVFEPLDLAELADAAVTRARRQYPDMRIELDLAGAASFSLRAWRDGLESLLDNLIRNAATHGRGEEGRAPVHVRLSSTGTEVRLEVSDHGPGIPEQDRERILERFTRGDGARGTGSGLGLALCAQQAALHGGSLEVIETAGGGATVTVTLPAIER